MTITPKKVFEHLIPPIFIWLYRKITSTESNPNILFDGDDALFKKIMQRVTLYGEYGCGKSTKWVLNNTSSKIMAVDTSQQWVDEVNSENVSNNDRLLIKHVDLGAVGGWGRPIDYINRHGFAEYTDFMWKQAEKPNVILIDGRFRVCCFLTALKYANEGAYLLFDDYIGRPHYHVVEKYVERSEECGRQCLFIVPSADKIDFEALDKDIISFRHVMD